MIGVRTACRNAHSAKWSLQKGQRARGKGSPTEVPVQAHTGKPSDWERDGKGVNHKKELKSKNNMDELGGHYAT